MNNRQISSEHQLLTIEEMQFQDSFSLSLSKEPLFKITTPRLSYTDSTFSGCLFLLISSSLSISLIHISYAVRRLGLILGLINILVGMFLAYFSCYCLIEVSHKLSRISYYGIGEKLWCRRFGRIVQMCMVVSCYLIYLRYLILLGFVLARATSILNWNLNTLPDHILFKFTFSIIVFLIASMRSIRLLKHTSKLSLLSALLFCLSVIYACFIDTDEPLSKLLSISTHFPDHSQNLTFLTLEILIISVNCQVNILTVYEELGHGDTYKVYKVLKYSTLVVAGVYICAGVFGSVLFYEINGMSFILMDQVNVKKTVVLSVRYM
jgi:amino acid permease